MMAIIVKSNTKRKALDFLFNLILGSVLEFPGADRLFII
jgi:hypothetical protein